jgi:hypothetical protein
MDTLAEYVDGLPSLCGQEPLISEAIEAGRQRPVFPGGADIERAAAPGDARPAAAPLGAGFRLGRNGA